MVTYQGETGIHWLHRSRASNPERPSRVIGPEHLRSLLVKDPASGQSARDTLLVVVPLCTEGLNMPPDIIQEREKMTFGINCPEL
jgi:hypothetical protein